MIKIKQPALAFFWFFGMMIGIFTLFTLLADGNIAVGYTSTGTPINWSDFPGYLVPLTLSLCQFCMAILQGFKRL